MEKHINKVCLDCIHQCKQSDEVVVQHCPQKKVAQDIGTHEVKGGLKK